MKTRIAFLLLVPVAWSTAPAGTGKSPDETLAAFVGEWKLDLSVDAATFGDRAGTGSGNLTCRWGPQQAWIDCELASEYDGLGNYGLKMVLYRSRDPLAIGAFVTNTFGGGRLYNGTWTDPDTLVFEDAWIDPAREWDYQRTTYTFGDDGEMRFDIEVSEDGRHYLAHSSGIYHRAPGSTGDMNCRQ